MLDSSIGFYPISYACAKEWRLQMIYALFTYTAYFVICNKLATEIEMSKLLSGPFDYVLNKIGQGRKK